MQALPHNQLGYTDIASKHEKHDTKASCGHSRATDLVTLISPQTGQNTIQKLEAGPPAQPVRLQ